MQSIDNPRGSRRRCPPVRDAPGDRGRSATAGAGAGQRRVSRRTRRNLGERDAAAVVSVVVGVRVVVQKALGEGYPGGDAREKRGGKGKDKEGAYNNAFVRTWVGIERSTRDEWTVRTEGRNYVRTNECMTQRASRSDTSGNRAQRDITRGEKIQGRTRQGSCTSNAL